MDLLRRRVHEQLLDLSAWLRQPTGGWYGINPIHPKKVANDNPVYNSRPLVWADEPPHVAEVRRLLDSAPREMQRIARLCYLDDGPAGLTARAERLGIARTTAYRHRNRLLDHLLAASLAGDAPRVSA